MSMTVMLEHLTGEVRKLTPAEFDQLRAWILDYQPVAGMDIVAPRADWSGHAARVREILGQDAPARENAVLSLRVEERL